MSQQEFEKEVLSRLTAIETQLKPFTDNCRVCQKTISEHGIELATVAASVKSAHHRLDSMQTNSTELKKELTEAIKEQIAGIYRTAMIVGGVTSLFVGLIFSLIMWVVTGHWGH